MTAFLTIADVAETVGVSPRTVLRWIDRGDLEAVRLPGGRLRVSQTELAERLRSWTTTTTTTTGERMMAPATQVGGHRANGPARGKESDLRA